MSNCLASTFKATGKKMKQKEERKRWRREKLKNILQSDSLIIEVTEKHKKAIEAMIQPEKRRIKY